MISDEHDPERQDEDDSADCCQQCGSVLYGVPGSWCSYCQKHGDKPRVLLSRQPPPRRPGGRSQAKKRQRG